MLLFLLCHPAAAAVSEPSESLFREARAGKLEAIVALGKFYGVHYATCSPEVAKDNWDKRYVVVICKTYKDAAKAVPWFLKAAQQGHRESQYRLAAMYADGAGVERDFEEAYFWYLLSKKAGYKAVLPDRDLGVLSKTLNAAEIRKARERAENWKPSSSPSKPAASNYNE